jgi:serine/threonine protein kinase
VDDSGRARLTDFGFSGIASDLGSAVSITDGHAVRWAAPEILDMEGPVSKESDVYSFAMVVIEVRACDHPNGDLTTHLHKVFTGRAPFYNSRPTTVAVDVLSGIRPERPVHSSLTDDLWDLTQRCLDHDPQQRPGISEIVFRLRGNHNSQGDDDATWDGTTFGTLRQGESPLGKLHCISHDKVALTSSEGSCFRLSQSTAAPFKLQRLWKFERSPVSHLGLGKITPDDIESEEEEEKHVDILHKSPNASELPLGKGGWFSRYKPHSAHNCHGRLPGKQGTTAMRIGFWT